VQAVLATPVEVNELGLMVLKLGQHLAPLMRELSGARVLVSRAPSGLEASPVGPVEVAGVACESPLLADERLVPLWLALLAQGEQQRVALRNFVVRGHNCQLASDECHPELTVRAVGESFVRLCWVHDHDSEQHGEQLAQLARHNLVTFWLWQCRSFLGLPAGHALSQPELCWWLALKGWIGLLPDSLAREVQHRPASSLRQTHLGWRDTDDLYREHAVDELVQLAKPVLELVIDADPPARHMSRPKPRYWQSRAYLDYVKSLPCAVCGAQGSDPHHLIGHGQGKMGGKAHDLFALPLCRTHHDELHRRGIPSWERQHGSQLGYLVATLDRAMKEGALG